MRILFISAFVFFMNISTACADMSPEEIAITQARAVCGNLYAADNDPCVERNFARFLPLYMEQREARQAEIQRSLGQLSESLRHVGETQVRPVPTGHGSVVCSSLRNGELTTMECR